jgi:hypothetical protein
MAVDGKKEQLNDSQNGITGGSVGKLSHADNNVSSEQPVRPIRDTEIIETTSDQVSVNKFAEAPPQTVPDIPDQSKQEPILGENPLIAKAAQKRRQSHVKRTVPTWARHKKILIPVMVLPIVMVLAIGSVYVITRAKNASMSVKINTITQASTSAGLPLINRDWSYKSSQYCNITLPLPPATAPFIDKTSNGTRTWQKEEFSTEQNNQRYTIARDIFKYPNENLATVEGVIIVYCSPNINNDTADSYVRKFQDRLKTDPALQGLTVQNMIKLTVWNRQVVKFTGKAQNGDIGEYFFFATKQHIYLIRRVSQSQNKFVIQTSQLIFDNLQFSEK